MGPATPCSSRPPSFRFNQPGDHIDLGFFLAEFAALHSKSVVQLIGEGGIGWVDFLSMTTSSPLPGEGFPASDPEVQAKFLHTVSFEGHRATCGKPWRFSTIGLRGKIYNTMDVRDVIYQSHRS